MVALLRSSAFAALLCASLSPVHAGPAWEGVYEGVLGPSRVIVSLSPDDARYAYAAGADDLGLIVAEAGGVLNITETVAPGIDAAAIKQRPLLASGRWTLQQRGEKLTGHWTAAGGGRGRDVSLTRVSRRAGPAGAYGARWLAAAAPFAAQGGETVFGPVAYTLLRDTLYGNVVPHLVRAPPGVHVEAVNKQLEKLLGTLVLRDRACAQDLRSSAALDGTARLAEVDGPGKNAAPAARQSMTPVFASASLLVLLESRSRFCGGAHPARSVAAFTFDLRAPRQISGLGEGTDDLASSALGAAFDFADAGKRTRFDSLWVERFRAAIARESAARDGDEIAKACGDNLGGQLESAGAGLDKIVYPLAQGLAIRATGFGHAASVCARDHAANPLVLPWADVKPFLKADQRLLPGQ